MYKSTILLIVILFVSKGIIAQEINKNRKKINATRVSSPLKIDGIIDEAIWSNVPVAKDFVMMRPNNGEAEPNTHKTEVKLVYDDEAIYVSAVMYAPDPSKIPAEFNNRDRIGNSDFFMLMVNPNDDGQNPTMFIVTASGVQADSKVSANNEDFNWNAVWKSAIKINEDNWSVEMKIPYRALRFANRPVQSWGFNFHRDIKNLNARFTWNHIDNTQGSWTQYDGLVEDFKDIKPPTRLNFYPYASATTISFEGKTDFDWSVGMDLKYGLTENFTLDATLIPDFSQVGFDDVSLNLGPFEQQFSEQRQFFTEGTELFTKGRLFYSRRIGSSPIRSASVDENNETLIDSPSKVQLLNAIKISGRTKNGLGIGFFNAITDKAAATIENNLTKEIRTEVVNPFSNYNIMVLDQQFNQNSSVTLINTNVTRNGRFRDANVTGLLWHVEDKGSNYNIDGSFKTSNISDDIENPNSGYSFDTSIGKHSGKWQGEIGYKFDTKDYNINDLGIQNRNNTQEIYGFASYRILKPSKDFNFYNIRFMYNARFLHESGTYTGNWIGLNAFFETKKRFAFWNNINGNIGEQFDYFEAREGSLAGVYFIRNPRIAINHGGSTDFRKKFAVDYGFFLNKFINEKKFVYGFRFSPRYRFSNKLSFIYNFRYRKNEADRGFVTKISDDDISENPILAPLLNERVFGQRDRTTYENTLSGKYSFSTKSSLSLSFRHNWQKAQYENQYYSLQSNGRLSSNTYKNNHDINFNSWNLDVNYLWQFAPGSQLIAFYRNSIFDENSNVNQNFTGNIENLLSQSHKHTFSVRLVYFIDYNNLKNIF